MLRAQSAKDKEEQHPQSITQIRKANIDKGTKKLESQISGGGLEEVDIGAAHPTSLSKLFPTDRGFSRINLICTWSAEMQNGPGDDRTATEVVGEHYLRSVSVRPALKTSECPITISSKYPAKVSHDFGSGAAVRV